MTAIEPVFWAPSQYDLKRSSGNVEGSSDLVIRIRTNVTRHIITYEAD